MPLEFPLVGRRITIRPFTSRDVSAMHKVYGDPVVMRYVGYGKPASVADTANMLASYIRHQRVYGYAFWAIIERRTGTVLGDVGFAEHNGEAEFGYTLGQQWWGRGLATEAGELSVRAAFDVLNLASIPALVDRENDKSARVLRKLGFEFDAECSAYERPHDRYVLHRSMGDDRGT